MTMPPRYLIVTGDDFGQTVGTTDGIVRAHAGGIVTSASLMVRYEAAHAAAVRAAEHPGLAVGLHLDLGEWTCSDGEWIPLYEVVCLENADEIEAEARAQLAAFRALLGRDPTHLDSHQHVHRSEPVRSVAVTMAGCLGVPLRECTPAIRYSGTFYGQTVAGAPNVDAISVEALVDVLEALPFGTTELGCHPASHDDTAGMYGAERGLELLTLCDGRVREALEREEVLLRSFHDLKCG
jgi:predicted glycoside hydrolase/deacetylase ChbG (UPF0249 family)